jgi:hypothetical protein
MMKPNNNRQVTFRRIRGRIVPVAVKREASAIHGTAKDLHRKRQSAAPAITKLIGFTAAGFGLAWGAGRIKKLSEVALKANKMRTGNALERVAKTVDFGGKFGASALAGRELTRLDKMTTKDEKSKIANFGSEGVGPVAIGVGIVGGYGAYRLSKRFQKWGYYGGKFPWKLRDL